jgi:hypothetical protein
MSACVSVKYRIRSSLPMSGNERGRSITIPWRAIAAQITAQQYRGP